MPHTGPLTPPALLVRPRAARYREEYRPWQGIPSIERTARGRMFAAWYTGTETEQGGNFVVVTTSEDEGETWSGADLVVEHADPAVRCYDPCLWRDPNGRLWLTWNQSRGFYDGRVGVWASLADAPDAAEPAWSPPRRIANGIMMNKPTVLSTGEWLFPCALWSDHAPTEDHPEMRGERYSNVYVTADGGRTFAYRGGADVPNRQFDEHMVVERADGSLWMLVRCYDGIGEAFSADGGRTWTGARRSGLDGPCSRFHIRRLPSGRLLLVTHEDFGERLSRDEVQAQGNVKVWKGRTNLTAMLSEDEGQTWPHRLRLDDRDDVSYPDVAVAEDGRMTVIYDWQRMTERQILIARITEDDIRAGEVGSPGSRLRLPVSVALGRAAPHD